MTWRVVRRRIGVAEYEDGWNVVIQIGGNMMVFDPSFPTEAEAAAKADEVRDALNAIDGEHTRSLS